MSGAISCHDAVRRFWDYLDGDLDATDRERIDAHLTFCLRCCGEMEFAQELRGVLAERAVTTVPEPARQRLESLIDRLEPPDADTTSPGGNP